MAPLCFIFFKFDDLGFQKDEQALDVAAVGAVGVDAMECLQTDFLELLFH